jgi:hypothetical protein
MLITELKATGKSTQSLEKELACPRSCCRFVGTRYGVGHVGLVMGAFNLGAFAALAGSHARRLRA